MIRPNSTDVLETRAFYPVFLDLTGRTAVVIGAGHIAEEKVRGLLAAGCSVRLVARTTTPELDARILAGEITVERRGYRWGDLRGAHIAIAADPPAHAAIHREAERRGILLNAVDDLPYCHFIAGAVHRSGDVIIAISTSGRSPALAVLIRQQIARLIGPEYGALAGLLGSLRSLVAAALPDSAVRTTFWKKLAVPAQLARMRRGQQVLVRRDALALLERTRAQSGSAQTARAAPRSPVGKVYIVGAGPGAVDLITQRALDRLRGADVIVYDRLVHPDLLNEAPHAERIYVGKAAGRQCVSQAEIHATLVRAAHAGKTVVRLKGGDPFVFGRGAEECEALRAAGVDFEVVPGISAALGAPAAAGISVTHRDHASAFAVVTGHRADELAQVDWAALARVPTLVVLMGLARIDALAAELIAGGRSADTPAAAISRATLPDQRTVVGTLTSIGAAVAAAGLESPVTLVVGDVVCLGAHATAELSGEALLCCR